MKTSDLTGAALDWAVAEADGLKTETWHTNAITVLYPGAPRFVPFMPSRDWRVGGPIIERERINTTANLPSTGWYATNPSKGQCVPFGLSPTPLVAAMRCYVASKLGDEVDVPEELR